MSQTLFLLYRPEPARPMLKTRSVGAHSICARGGLSCRKRARADMESAPTFFVAGGVPSQRRCPAWSFLSLLKAKSVGAHSICARGGLSCRKRAQADMESAPTFFVAGGVPPRRGRRPAWSCLPLLKAKSVGAHSICARGGLPYRKRTRADMESAPTFFVAGGVPSQRRCPAWSCLPLLKAKSVGAHSICARGGLSYRKRARADMESAPTFFCRGGQGARFCLLCVQADLFPLAPCQKPSYVVYYFSTSPQANPVQTGDAKL